MTDNTSIEWTDATWNPIGGCTRVSEGCRNCYAEVMAARFSKPGQWGHGLAEIVRRPDGTTDHRWTGNVVLHEGALDRPLRWQQPRRIFVNSTSDLFHEEAPDEWIDLVFAVMALAPRHTFQVLTKRPERARAYLLANPGIRIRSQMPSIAGPLPVIEMDWPLPNVWLGTSVEDRATADARIPHLLATPAAVRFVSAEPLLGPVDLTRITEAEPACPGGTSVCGWYLDALAGDAWDDENGALTGEYRGTYGNARLDWVIVGGESGPGARPMNPDWARSLRDQCSAANVAFFMKQMAKKAPIPKDLLVREWPAP
jgi:protein gp37